ncbi:unnamed protein product [Arabis nemorensis]|uniref:snRNA-activating protein complex subunit n=1 Tax=Arabis nemorensis TaxID=586526 RepID=A0A565AU71_9BRAS|nr:unnamed protein product [Arabis nemorensis]
MENEMSEGSDTSGVPRGGPVYLPNMVAPFSTVPEFQSSFLNLLQDLETHLSPSSYSSLQSDLSTHSLKIFTDEELTDMAMKDAFPENNLSQNEQSLNASHHENPSNRGSKTTKTKRTVKNTEETYVAKIEPFVKLKQKQEDDKAAVKLHCFSKTCDNGKDVGTSEEGFEQMQSLKFVNNYTLGKPSDSQGSDRPVDTLFPEVILCVEIHNTAKVKTQEFLVLGRQALTVLKDKIHCLTDQVMEMAGTYDPSGYFLIEDVFYNDLRNPSATDYSKPILNWLWNSKDEALQKWECILTGEVKEKQKTVIGEANSMDLPRFGSADMQSTRFCDLRFRLGASYLYCHQGDCKHTIVIRDMRLSHQEDVQNRAAYPRLMFQRKPRAQKCSVCKINRASRFTVDDKWAKENPCYFCDMCLAEYFKGGSLNPLHDYPCEEPMIPLLQNREEE